MPDLNRVPLAACLTLAILGLAAPALAQLNGQHIKGSVGLKAGSQPPPGGYVVIPVLYFYGTDEVKNRDGETLPAAEYRCSPTTCRGDRGRF